MTARDAYVTARYNGYSQELEQDVINSGDPRWAYQFAFYIKGANTPRLEQVVIDSGDLDWAFNFAYDVKDANISDLIDFVLIKEPELIKNLFDRRPDLRRKYELGETRKQIRAILK